MEAACTFLRVALARFLGCELLVGGSCRFLACVAGELDSCTDSRSALTMGMRALDFIAAE